MRIEEPEDSSNVLDLTELLRQSLQGAGARAPRKPAARKAPPPARKTSSRVRGAKTVH